MPLKYKNALEIKKVKKIIKFVNRLMFETNVALMFIIFDYIQTF